jgi:hypothetical protein
VAATRARSLRYGETPRGGWAGTGRNDAVCHSIDLGQSLFRTNVHEETTMTGQQNDLHTSPETGGSQIKAGKVRDFFIKVILKNEMTRDATICNFAIPWSWLTICKDQVTTHCKFAPSIKPDQKMLLRGVHSTYPW